MYELHKIISPNNYQHYLNYYFHTSLKPIYFICNNNFEGQKELLMNSNVLCCVY